MRPAELKKRAMDPLYSERLLEEALSDISENAHARKLQHVEPHPGRGTTTRRAAFHFVTYKILQDFPNEGARLSADRNSKIVQIFLNAIIKRLFFAKSCHAGFSEGFSRPIRRTAGMGREGECADRSRPFDFAVAPLKVTECCHSERSRRRSRGISTVGRA